MATIAKCPACGALRQSFSAVCPDCNYEFTDIRQSDAIRQFADRIDEYDRLIVTQNDGKEKKVGFWIVIAWIFLFPIMFAIFIVKKIKAKNAQLEGNENLKSQAILNFPVPNSRNDLIEFSLLVESRVKPINYFNALSDSGMNTQKWNKIWLEKAAHIEKKAQIALQDDPSSLNSIRSSAANMRNQISRNDQMQWAVLGVLALLFVVVIILSNI